MLGVSVYETFSSPTQITKENVNYVKTGIYVCLFGSSLYQYIVNTQYINIPAFSVEQMDKNLVIAGSLSLLSYPDAHSYPNLFCLKPVPRLFVTQNHSSTEGLTLKGGIGRVFVESDKMIKSTKLKINGRRGSRSWSSMGRRGNIFGGG